LFGLLAAAALVPSAKAQEVSFLKITNPPENQVYGPKENCLVTGAMQMSGPKTKIELMLLRITVYQPRRQEFIWANQSAIEMAKAVTKSKDVIPGTVLYSFRGDVALPKEPGEYLLRVDCLDWTDDKHPRNIIATQSIFIRIRPGEKAKGNTVTINTPPDTQSIGPGTNIPVEGTSTEPNVKKMRITFDKGGTEYQIVIVEVKNGKWAGILNNPLGGWPLTNAEIRAVGLDGQSNHYGGENAKIKVKVQQ